MSDTQQPSETTTTMATSEPESIPKPYSLLRHPYLTWTDAFLSYIMPYIMNLSALVPCDPNSEQAKEKLTKLRQQLKEGSHGLFGKVAVKKWSDASGGDRLAEYAGEVPFQKNILKDWKIIANNDKETADVFPDCVASRDKVKILVRFPSRLLSVEEREKAKVLEYSGCLEVNELDLNNFATTVPFLLQFHGGGLIMGGAHKPELLNETAALVSTFAEENGVAPPDVVTISVEYGLSPEVGFPVPVMDALSVVDYLLAGNSSRKIHLSGESAGANISLVAGLESFRKYSGRILSIQSQCPMLNPAGDTMSFYMNQNAFPDMNWLRWCWRAYLRLDAPKDNEDDSSKTVEEALRKDSNFTTWNKWKGMHSTALQRLINPSVDLPPKIDSEDAPQIFLRINRGDPLFDEGKELATVLEKEGAKVKLFAENGLHCAIGGHFDLDASKKAMIVLSNELFQSSR